MRVGIEARRLLLLLPPHIACIEAPQRGQDRSAPAVERRYAEKDEAD